MIAEELSQFTVASSDYNVTVRAMTDDTVIQLEKNSARLNNQALIDRCLIEARGSQYMHLHNGVNCGSYA